MRGRITRRSFVTLPVVVGAARGTSGPYEFQHDNVMGTSMELIVFAPSMEEARRAEAATLSEIDRLCGHLSTYDTASEISRHISSARALPCSPDLGRLLAHYEDWERRTGGVISINAGNATQHLAWNVDALGKAYILENAAVAARRASSAISELLLNIGGDIVAMGSPFEEPWRVGVAEDWRENAAPVTTVFLTDQAMATSGNQERGWHIIDPRSGRPATGADSATVIAPDSITANALATALCILSAQRGRDLVESTPKAECLVQQRDGKKWRSSGFAKYERPRIEHTSAAGWPNDYELSLTITLKVTAGLRSRRPYIAIWAEDTNGVLVRTIVAWASKQRWMPELRSWWTLNHGSEAVYSIARATRPPGRYRVVWNGLDDKGHPVPPGPYRIVVETSREHGSYTKESNTILCAGKAANTTLKETIEYEEITVDFGPRKQTV